LASAVARGQWVDRVGIFIALIGVSAPPFWLGLLLLYWLGYLIPIFPLGGTGSLAHLILPSLTAGLGGAAWYARMMRSSTLDILSADYVRTARAKGLSDRHILLRHALRGGLLPVVSFSGPALAYLVTGTVVVERIFALPGLGNYFINANLNRDEPLIIGIVAFLSITILVFNLIVDIVYGFIDPRIRY
jgi:ABC-type dipeptide/oligopeptide/nickel transport system permease component